MAAVTRPFNDIRHMFSGWVSALLLHQSDTGQTAELAQNIQVVMDKVDVGDQDVLNELEHLHSAVQLSGTLLDCPLPAALFGELVFVPLQAMRLMPPEGRKHCAPKTKLYTACQCPLTTRCQPPTSRIWQWG